MKKNNNSMFIVISGIIISVSRIILGKIENTPAKDLAILVIMAVINCVAFGFVILLLLNDLNEYVNEKLTKSGMETTKKKRCKRLMYITSFIFLSLYLIFGILYLLYFKSSNLNDAFSILALAISIATNGLVNGFKLTYYNIIIKLSSKSIKNILSSFSHKKTP